MGVIEVNTSDKYRVIIENDLIDRAGEHILQIVSACKVCILSDDNVFRLYGERTKNSLAQAGFTAFEYIIPHGEGSKNGENYLKFLSFLAQNAFSRSDLLVALGGGVAGDLCGFAAATYLRGIKYVQMPTTLLSMVDSSVGGKTAIDLNEGKNLCGAFYQPSMVLCDLSALDTLPYDVFCDGMAEVIKYGVIADEELFEHIRAMGRKFDREYVVSRCIDIKRQMVEKDERDEGLRQMLNFGHTAGHAVEKLSQFTVSHGRAVAIGMAAVTRSSVREGLCTRNCAERLAELLKVFSLPVSTDYSAQELTQAMMNDKKRRGDKITLIVPLKIGKAEKIEMDISQASGFIARGMDI